MRTEFGKSSGMNIGGFDQHRKYEQDPRDWYKQYFNKMKKVFKQVKDNVIDKAMERVDSFLLAK